MPVHAGGQIFINLVGERVGGQGDDRGALAVVAGLRRADLARGVDAVHHRHLDIHQHQVVATGPPRLDRLLAVGDDVDVDAQRVHHRGQHLTVGGIVLGGQQAQVTVAGVRRGLGFAHGGDLAADQRQFDGEGRALALAAFHLDCAAHHLRELATDRQAQPGAAEPAGGGVVGLGELLEQRRQFLRRDADAGIVDHQAQGAAVAIEVDADIDRAARGELDRVGEQVADNLAQTVRVAAPPATDLVGQRQVERQALALGQHPEGLDRRRQRRGQIKILGHQAELTRLDLRQVEHVVQHRQQQTAGLADDAQPFALDLRQVAHGHHFGHGQDAVQRGADLMAHIGQELGLQNVGGIGRVAGVLQFTHGAPEVGLALAELAEQVVETVGQAAEQLILRPDLHRLEAAAAGHLMHRFRQPQHRRDYPVGHATRQEQRHADAAEQQRRG